MYLQMRRRGCPQSAGAGAGPSRWPSPGTTGPARARGARRGLRAPRIGEGSGERGVLMHEPVDAIGFFVKARASPSRAIPKSRRRMSRSPGRCDLIRLVTSAVPPPWESAPGGPRRDPVGGPYVDPLSSSVRISWGPAEICTSSPPGPSSLAFVRASRSSSSPNSRRIAPRTGATPVFRTSGRTSKAAAS